MTRRRHRPKSTPDADPVVIKREPDGSPVRGHSPSMLRSTPLPSATAIKAAVSRRTGTAASVPEVERSEVDEYDADILEISHRITAVRIREGSVMSVQEAQISIDSFLDDETKPDFISKRESKLRLWQALCIEFGLCHAEPENRASLVAIQEESDQDVNIQLHSPTLATLPALPTSLNQAKLLLKANAHVNIKDYLDERRKPLSAGQTRDMSHFLHPSTSALIRYTIKNKRFAKPSVVKDAYLEPLMREMSFGRRRR